MPSVSNSVKLPKQRRRSDLEREALPRWPVVSLKKTGGHSEDSFSREDRRDPLSPLSKALGEKVIDSRIVRDLNKSLN